MRTFAIAALCVCLVGAVSSAGAKEIELKDGGDLQGAINAAAAGDTITLKGGDYRGDFRVGRGGFTLRSAPGERAKIKGTGGTNVYFSHCKDFKLIDLDFEGGQGYGIDFDGCQNVLMEGCRIFGGHGELVKVSPGTKDITISRCEIFDNNKAAAEGIDACNVERLTVKDCFIHDIGANGAYSKGGSKHVVYERCLFTRIGLNPSTYGAGVSVGQVGGWGQSKIEWQNEDSVVRNCVFIDINGAAVIAQGALRPTIVNNTIINCPMKDRATFCMIPGPVNTAKKTATCKDVTISNNLVVGGGGRPWVWIYPGGLEGTLVMQNNVFTGGGAKFVDNRAGWKECRDVAAWEAAIGNSSGNKIIDPKVDKTGHLEEGSPCIDAAVVTDKVSDDYDGAKRTDGKPDIGADEFKAGPERPVPPSKGSHGTVPPAKQ